MSSKFFFFFQAEDGIRDATVTGVQTCALPISFDGEVPDDARGYFIDEYINKGIMRPAEIAGGAHCMAPAYLENQLERSRRNLKLETVDVFYVHNPESQLGA